LIQLIDFAEQPNSSPPAVVAGRTPPQRPSTAAVAKILFIYMTNKNNDSTPLCMPKAPPPAKRSAGVPRILVLVVVRPPGPRQRLRHRALVLVARVVPSAGVEALVGVQVPARGVARCCCCSCSSSGLGRCCSLLLLLLLPHRFLLRGLSCITCGCCCYSRTKTCESPRYTSLKALHR
jgi:hypothetical protein